MWGDMILNHTICCEPSTSAHDAETRPRRNLTAIIIRSATAAGNALSRKKASGWKTARYAGIAFTLSPIPSRDTDAAGADASSPSKGGRLMRR